MVQSLIKPLLCFQKFYFDPRRLHWPTYMEDLQLGTKKYLLKEDMAGIPAARAHIKKWVSVYSILSGHCPFSFGQISMTVLPLLLIQEEQLSVTGKRMCTKYW